MRIAISILLTAATGLAACSQQSAQDAADIVLLNGGVYTVDADRSWAEAAAIDDGLIIAVGSNAEIEPFIGDATRVLELEGLFAVPGLIEGHGHYMSYGASLMELDLRGAESWDAIVAMVEEAVGRAEPGEWIVGRGWHQSKWERAPQPNVDGYPVHTELSTVVSEMGEH